MNLVFRVLVGYLAEQRDARAGILLKDLSATVWTKLVRDFPGGNAWPYASAPVGSLRAHVAATPLPHLVLRVTGGTLLIMFNAAGTSFSATWEMTLVINRCFSFGSVTDSA